MDAYVVIATKGRATVTLDLLAWLQEQSLQPRRVYVVGTEPADVAGVAAHPLALEGLAHAILGRPGLCAQRNRGLTQIQHERSMIDDRNAHFVAFFDDDFRPDPHWLRACREAFLRDPDVAGITGRILADGVLGDPIPSLAARAYVEGRRAPLAHWGGSTHAGQVNCLYGCNMAFRDRVVEHLRFDENLPLYGWQEDQDFSSRAAQHGRLLHLPECRGVHLGVKSGRVSGVRFGYSQIANPWYLARKRTMSVRKSVHFASKNFVGNVLRSVLPHPDIDYAGRLRGNLIAIADLLRGKSHPRRIVELH